MNVKKPDDDRGLGRDLLRELDELADQDPAYWQTQRQAIHRRLQAESRPHGGISGRKPLWALAGVSTTVAGVLVAVTLFLAPDLLVTPNSTDATNPVQQDPDIDPTTAALLRSVETTLASDVAPSLAAVDVLLAEMEAEFTLLQTRSNP